MAKDTISILDGTFIVSDRRRDVNASPVEPHERLELRGVPGRWDRTDAFADLLEATR